MRLEWALLVLPLVLFVRVGMRVRARRLESDRVNAVARPLSGARTVHLGANRGWSGRSVCWVVATGLLGALTVAAFAVVIWGFAAEPPGFDVIAAGGFAAMCVFGTGAALLMWQARPAVVVPARIRALGRATAGIVFATPPTASLRRFLAGVDVPDRVFEVYLAVESEGLSFWVGRGRSTVVEVARVPASSVESVRRLGLPRTAGVDEAVVTIRDADGRTSMLDIAPFTRAFDSARALGTFLESTAQLTR